MRIGILVSGRGSNMKAILDACAEGLLDADVAVVVSNRPKAGALGVARGMGVPTQVVPHRAYADRSSFEEALHQVLVDAKVELVCLAGFMRLLTDGFVERWHDRLVNIHPSLLPAFRGLDTHQRALDAGARFAGCTIHFVRPAMDAGPIIAQAVVPVRQDDTAETLGARVLACEHRLYPLVLGWIAADRVRVEGERAQVDGVEAPHQALLNPSPGSASGAAPADG